VPPAPQDSTQIHPCLVLLSTNYDDKDEEGGERKVRKKKKSKGKKTTRTSIPNHDYNHLIIVNQII